MNVWIAIWQSIRSDSTIDVDQLEQSLVLKGKSTYVRRKSVFYADFDGKTILEKKKKNIRINRTGFTRWQTGFICRRTGFIRQQTGFIRRRTVFICRRMKPVCRRMKPVRQRMKPVHLTFLIIYFSLFFHAQKGRIKTL